MEYLSTNIRSARDVSTIFKLLNIKEISTDTQRKKGTHVYELPIKKMYASGYQSALRFAVYESGYVRNLSEHLSSCYQLNKTIDVKSETSWGQHTHKERVLIPDWEDRLIYLCKYILKNYYHKNSYSMCSYNTDLLKEQRQEMNELRQQVKATNDGPYEVKVIIDGHRYNLY